MSNTPVSAQDEARRALDQLIDRLIDATREAAQASERCLDDEFENALRRRETIRYAIIDTALRAPSPERAAEEMRELPRIEFHQQDFIPGFAAFLPGATTPSPDSKAFCVINLGSMLSTVYHGDTAREDLPYFLADSIMHEIIHALEQWAGVEFNEDRVDALIEKYRALPVPADLDKGGGNASR